LNICYVGTFKIIKNIPIIYFHKYYTQKGYNKWILDINKIYTFDKLILLHRFIYVQNKKSRKNLKIKKKFKPKIKII